MYILIFNRQNKKAGGDRAPRGRKDERAVDHAPKKLQNYLETSGDHTRKRNGTAALTFGLSVTLSGPVFGPKVAVLLCGRKVQVEALVSDWALFLATVAQWRRN